MLVPWRVHVEVLLLVPPRQVDQVAMAATSTER